jgi:Family of unknown function (DUF5946)
MLRAEKIVRSQLELAEPGFQFPQSLKLPIRTIDCKLSAALGQHKSGNSALMQTMNDEAEGQVPRQTVCGCGLTAPATGGPTHRYIVSTPECWATYGRVLARQYENYAALGGIHQMTVDAYAVHHPWRQPAKSLVGHLLSLYITVGLGRDAVAARDVLRRFVESGPMFLHLSPPRDLGPLTVRDVAEARSFDQHITAVNAWAKQLWEAWSDSHELIVDLAIGRSR